MVIVDLLDNPKPNLRPTALNIYVISSVNLSKIAYRQMNYARVQEYM